MAVVSGEVIRMMNFVDDIAATLRRVVANYSFLTAEEKVRIADYMEKAEPNYPKVVADLRANKNLV
ncbi:MAG TPA: hypothetical protein VGL89_00515 [Candidatus Koribacter sp.]|jgi:hypothetical protein